MIIFRLNEAIEIIQGLFRKKNFLPSGCMLPNIITDAAINVFLKILQFSNCEMISRISKFYELCLKFEVESRIQYFN